MSNQTAPFDDDILLDCISPPFSDMETTDDDVPIISRMSNDPYQEVTEWSERQKGSAGEDDRTVVATAEPVHEEISRKRAYLIIIILFFINMLNYMDRFTVAGVLLDVKKYYVIDNSEAGLIQTSFIVSYMLFSPFVGFLGDRWNRKYIMTIGIFLWSLLTLAGSFIDREYFWAFLLLRAMVGIGEASYATIAPTIIADLFHSEMRLKMLMVFYFAVPIGSGMGYIVGSNVALLFHDWKYALRVTPLLGVVCLFLIVVFVKEPQRGQAEGGTHLRNTSYIDDLKALAKNKSFILSSLGFTSVAFVAGALSLWAPSFMYDSILVQGVEADVADVGLIFGGITVAAGFIGVGIGAEWARRWKKTNPRANPIICAIGMLGCMPFLFVAIVTSRFNTPVTWVLIFISSTLLCLNWALVVDILLAVVIPTRRSTAEAIQILMSHLLGDASSPYIIGAISDALANTHANNPLSPSIQFVTLQKALYINTFASVLGGGAFLATALFIQKDKAKVDKVIKTGKIQQSNGSETSSSSGDVPEPLEFPT